MILLAALLLCARAAHAQEAPQWAKASRVEALENRVSDLEAKIDKLIGTTPAKATAAVVKESLTAPTIYSASGCYTDSFGRTVCPTRTVSYSAAPVTNYTHSASYYTPSAGYYTGSPTYYTAPVSYFTAAGDDGPACAVSEVHHVYHRRPGPVARFFGAGY
jgi:hypothetical protein